MKKIFLFFLPIFALTVVGMACGLLPEGGLETLTLPTDRPPTKEDESTLSPLETLSPTNTFPAPTSTPTKLPATEASQPTTQTAPEFGVILVEKDDVLNVRSGPGVENDIIDTLNPHAGEITQTGNHQKVGNSMWVAIDTPSGANGWVNALYLTEIVNASKYCHDPRVEILLDDFVQAVQNQNGDALFSLVSPTHGLTVRVNWWNPPVNFREKPSIVNLFTDTSTHDWGIQNGSGKPIQGSFKDVVLPKMQDVFSGEFTQHCNNLEQGTGDTAGMVVWPYEYQNINYTALYRQAVPGDELNWRTWAVGVEYVRGEPYIAFLVQYHWEI